MKYIIYCGILCSLALCGCATLFKNEAQEFALSRQHSPDFAVFQWHFDGPIPMAMLNGTIGKLIWQDDCILFQVYRTNQIITPVFAKNSAVQYTNNALIQHSFQYPIDFNHWHYFDGTIHSSKNYPYFYKKAPEHCLMDTVIILNSDIIYADSQYNPKY